MAWTDTPAADGAAECAALVAAAARLRWSAPEVAVQFAARAIARGAEAATATEARHLVAIGLAGLGRVAEAVEPGIAALRSAVAAGRVDDAITLRTTLAACARALGDPLAGAEILRPAVTGLAVAGSPALAATDPSPPAVGLPATAEADSGPARLGLPPAVRARALAELAACLSHLAGRDDVEDTLAEADRLLAADETLSSAHRRVERAMVCAHTAAYHRRHGDTESAADAAHEGLAILPRPTHVDAQNPSGQGAVTQSDRHAADRDGAAGADVSGVRARLTYELACALLDEGAPDEAVAACAALLSEPVRATEASSVGRLRLAIATRVHLPAGRTDLGRTLLLDTIDTAQRHGHDTILADALTFLAHGEETSARPTEALHALRSARAAEHRHHHAAARARRLITAEFAPNRDPDHAVALLRAVVRPPAPAVPLPTQSRRAADPARTLAEPPTSEPGQHHQPSGSDQPRPVPEPGQRSRDGQSGEFRRSSEHGQSRRERAAGEFDGSTEPGQSRHQSERGQSRRQSISAELRRLSQSGPFRRSSESGQSRSEPASGEFRRLRESGGLPEDAGAHRSAGPDAESRTGRRRAVDEPSAPETAHAEPGPEEARQHAQPGASTEASADTPDLPAEEPGFTLILVRVEPVGRPDAVDPAEPALPVGDDRTINALASRVRDLAPTGTELVRSDRGEFAVLLPRTVTVIAEQFAGIIRKQAARGVWLADVGGTPVTVRTAVANHVAGGVARGLESLLQAARATLLGEPVDQPSVQPDPTPPDTAARPSRRDRRPEAAPSDAHDVLSRFGITAAAGGGRRRAPDDDLDPYLTVGAALSPAPVTATHPDPDGVPPIEPAPDEIPPIEPGPDQLPPRRDPSEIPPTPGDPSEIPPISPDPSDTPPIPDEPNEIPSLRPDRGFSGKPNPNGTPPFAGESNGVRPERADAPPARPGFGRVSPAPGESNGIRRGIQALPGDSNRAAPSQNGRSEAESAADPLPTAASLLDRLSKLASGDPIPSSTVDPKPRGEPGQRSDSAITPRPSPAMAEWLRRAGRPLPEDDLIEDDLVKDPVPEDPKPSAEVAPPADNPAQPDDAPITPTRPGSRRDRSSNGLADLLAEALAAFQSTQPADASWEDQPEPRSPLDVALAARRPIDPPPRQGDGGRRRAPEDGHTTDPDWTPGRRAARRAREEPREWVADARAADPTDSPPPVWDEGGRHRSSGWAPADIDGV